MQAIILAAGMGRRLGNITHTSTKCMVELNGKKLIDHILDNLVGVGIRNIIMVIGHGADEVKQYLGSNYREAKIEYVLNSVYDKTNNIYSLLLAKEYLISEDTLLLESDLIFERRILEDCINDGAPNVAVVAKYEPWMDGTVTVLDEDGHISSFVSKKDFSWTDSDRYFKTANIYKLSSEFCKNEFVPFLSAYTAGRGMNGYYEEVLKLLAFVDSKKMKAMPIRDASWYEIDDIQDLDIASTLFSNKKDRLKKYHERYGGYWRFPRLKDYCYLVNPYFPTSRLMDELRSNFSELISRYPSGQNVQNLLASKMFNCDPASIVVGNGAAELIRALMAEYRGNVGIPVPTFNEYYETLQHASLIEYRSKHDNFGYAADDLLRFVDDNKLSALVLINPDNPTGHYLQKANVLELAGELDRRNVTLILDESFIDFVNGSLGYSCIDDDILMRYKNLIVVRSISKSHGVPGLRLGMLASANSAVISKVRSKLAIWNINSFAEYFLQVIGKYTDEYKTACERLVIERDRVHEELKQIDIVEPITSYSNYIMCKVVGPWTSSEMTEIMLKDSWVLLKDCMGKKGIEDRSYIRIAIRNEKDNNEMLRSLRRVGDSK